MPSRPANLIYGVDDVPPPSTLFLLAVQHIFLMSSTLVLPIVLISEISGDVIQTRALVALTMISCGIGTVLQAGRWRGIGSGFLCPNLCGPNFFAASIGAAWLGGLPLMRGMTIAAGLIEVVFARFLHRLAFLFPSHITGLVVLMVALSLVPLGSSHFLDIAYAGEPIQAASLAVAAITLLTMAGLNIWGGSKLKLYGLLIGLAIGYSLSAAIGLIDPAQYRAVAQAPWIGLPARSGLRQLAFDWSLLPAFAIVSICGALKSFGNLVTCEKVNDAAWTQPDLHRIGDGLVADGICVTLSGLLGGMATDTSASNVGLSGVTGATSRWIGVAAGVLFALLGLSPKLGAVLSVMPAPVGGAILIFVACFMIMSGIQIIVSTPPDTRKTFVIGISLIFGLSLDILPELYVQIPGWLRPLFNSSLTLATVLAVLLHQLFRFGAEPASQDAPEAASEG
jgi:xanthine permease XanP